MRRKWQKTGESAERRRIPCCFQIQLGRSIGKPEVSTISIHKKTLFLGPTIALERRGISFEGIYTP